MTEKIMQNYNELAQKAQEKNRGRSSADGHRDPVTLPYMSKMILAAHPDGAGATRIWW